jgi:anti-sigma regulatory factor (Ser/Thr protein kinase)
MVSEVVSNAVCHGQPDQDGRIGLRLEAERGVVRAVVSDGAPEFSYRRDAVEAVEGVPHGLFMVDKLADRWGLSLDGKKAVWFEVDTRARAAYGSQGGKALALLR